MHSSTARRLPGALLAVLALAATPTIASASGRTLADADYARAESFLGNNAGPLVDHAVTRVTWLGDDRFWYRDHDASGDHFMVMGIGQGAKPATAFDHARLAEALSKATGKPVKADKLPVTSFTVAADGGYTISTRGKDYLCDAALKACAESTAKGGDEPGVRSPDDKSEAFVRDWNLWVRDVATGKETQLTRDGTTDYGYATDNAGWVHSDRAIVLWSPDSKRIATFQQDQRKTGSMTLVSTKVGHPDVQTWKYPFVGDKDITMIERVIVDASTGKVLRLKMPPDQHRSTQCDDVSCFGGWEDVQWAPDAKTLAFVSSSRDHKDAWLKIADTSTGAIREVMHEHVPTWFESGIDAINWRYLAKSGEILWWSQRTNWGELYLYDAATGKLKHAVTSGDGNVAEVVRVDESSRTVWFTGTGRTAGLDPYYQQLFKVSLDGGAPVLLTPEPANHTITLSPDGKHFVDSWSTPVEPQVAVLRDSNSGATVAPIATADISRLKAAGWVPPVQFTVKARDGKTDLYGLMFKPTNFDASKKYPVVDYVYPGPQVGSVGSRSFSPARGDHQALAELGFIVVLIDGMGTPYRSKAFHDGYAGDVADNTLPDQVAGLKELGARNPWMDLGRIGIWGHSGGGNATAGAMFHYPDFFKVGWAESGNHENRNYEDDWAEKWQGLLATDKDGKTNYDTQANWKYAKNLKGKLMLTHGLLDDNVPPSSTLLVVDALIKANKDFDLILLPNARHGYGMDSYYIMRRRWDYFVRNLAGDTPPDEYRIAPPQM
ncbi:MAG TPA: DPP IV N-terminal domain-containing protein [Luteimonas sp.]|nr:DPP IV N-terminal domain-containing protein [Luteimonas sp.]